MKRIKNKFCIPIIPTIAVITVSLCLFHSGLSFAEASLNGRIDRVIQKARQGELVEAISDLQELGKLHPENTRILFDLSVLFLQDNRYKEALGIINSFPLEQLPAYLVEEAMRSLRDAGRYSDSLIFAAEYRRRNPQLFSALAFEVLIMADAGVAEKAMQQAEKLTAMWPDSFEAWNVQGYVYERAGDNLSALRYYQKSLSLQPGNGEGTRRKIVVLERLGAISLAAELARQEQNLLQQDELKRVATSHVAKLISQAQQEPTDELRRMQNQQALDEILALYKDQVLKISDADDEYTMRLRYDRIVALRDHNLMQEVREEFEALLQREEVPPAYVREAAADAYLYLEEPEIAVELYRKLVEQDTHNMAAKAGLFFALVECENIREAHDLALKWEEESPAWIKPEDVAGPQPNPEKTSFAELVNLSLYFADQLPEAQNRLETMVEHAPNMSSLRTTLGDLYRSRGWIAKAVEQYELTLALDPNNISALEGLAAIDLQRNQFQSAEDAMNTLLREYPQRKSLQRLQRELKVNTTWDLMLESGYEDSDGETFASESSFLGGRLFTPIVWNSFRLFGEYKHQTGTFLEGRENLNRYGVGVLYRDDTWEAEFSSGWVDATVDDPTVSGRVTWQPDDYLRIGAGAELYSKETPLRAIKNGVNADRVELVGGYRQSESLDWRWRLGYMDFSDGNRKTDFSTGVFKRLYNYHRFVLDGDVAMYFSHATLEDAAYFNPELQISVPVTLNAQYLLWRRYNRSFWNSLALEVGPAYQKEYDTDLNWSVNYKHLWKIHPGWEIVYGIGYASRVYDGDRENSWSLTFSVQ